MTNREQLRAMSDDDLADWICMQMFPDYHAKSNNPLIDMTRFHTVRNFLMMEAKEDDYQNKRKK